MFTKFGVDSSSRFPFRVRTHTYPHTHIQSHRRYWSPIPRISYAGVGYM